MAYCTLEEIASAITEDDVAQLSDDEHIGAINTQRVNEAIARADALIDAFASSVPDPVPQIIRQISVDLSIYHLYKRRFASDMPESIDKVYARSIDLLKQIQSGRMSIGAVESDKALTEGQYKTSKAPSDRMFGAATWERY